MDRLGPSGTRDLQRVKNKTTQWHPLEPEPEPEPEPAGLHDATMVHAVPVAMTTRILNTSDTTFDAAVPFAVDQRKLILSPTDTIGGCRRNDEFRVLLVEDNPVNMKLLSTLCKRTKIKYAEASDGAEAVTKFVSFRPSVVLLDISLPVQDGFEACKQMRAVGFPSWIVAVTALSSEDDKSKGIYQCGMDAWMTKPISTRQLKIDLERWRDEFSQRRGLF